MRSVKDWKLVLKFIIHLDVRDVMPNYEIVDAEGLRMVKVALNGDTVRGESGALHYMRGNIEMVTQRPSAGGFLKSMVTGEDVFRPTYSGTGEVYLALLLLVSTTCWS
ncbi:MAG: hypothetical protein Ct9H300mP30_1640 [Methanobacteriota archaeon]|nr:MAG: hypothetical protein Ct9H300mP30_1640 [Euryarchaeota archaeon]